MLKCPKCGEEIRYIAGAPSAGTFGQPIAVDIALETLISNTGRRLQGYREHICKPVEGSIYHNENHDFYPSVGDKG
jgi:hypothetical protein